VFAKDIVSDFRHDMWSSPVNSKYRVSLNSKCIDEVIY
jgi:hypothetical protein